MAGLKYPTKGRLDLASPLEPMKLMVDGHPVVGMIVGDQLLTICNERGMGTMRISSANVTFLGYLTREESFTLIGSEDPDWVMPEDTESLASDIPIGSPARDVPDFIPYRMEVMGRTFEAINVPCDGVSKTGDYKKRILLCWSEINKDKGLHQWSSLDSTSSKFMGYLADLSLDRWRRHSLISGYGVREISKWPT